MVRTNVRTSRVSSSWVRASVLSSTVLAASACTRTHFESGGVRYAIDPNACCAVRDGTDFEAEAAACEARGCTWQPALVCMGVPFPDAEAEAEHRERGERCERRCACVCAEDVEACTNVP